MKKYLLLFLVLLIVTGCNAKYDLEITNDTFSENIELKVDNSDVDEIEYFNNNNLLTNSTTNNNVYYEKTSENDGIYTLYNFKHTFTMDEYQNSLASQFFSVFKVNEVDGYYTIIAKNFQKYDGYDAVPEEYEINIKTNYNVINNNADKVNNNVYTWTINKTNYKNKSIILQYTKTEKKENIINKVIPIIISCVIGIIYYFVLVFIRNKENNERN